MGRLVQNRNGTLSYHPGIFTTSNPGHAWTVVSTSGNDVAGIVVMTSGHGAASGDILNITFSANYVEVPVVQVTVDFGLSVAATAVSQSGFTITSYDVGGVVRDYTFIFQVILP